MPETFTIEEATGRASAATAETFSPEQALAADSPDVWTPDEALNTGPPDEYGVGEEVRGIARGLNRGVRRFGQQWDVNAIHRANDVRGEIAAEEARIKQAEDYFANPTPPPGARFTAGDEMNYRSGMNVQRARAGQRLAELKVEAESLNQRLPGVFADLAKQQTAIEALPPTTAEQEFLQTPNTIGAKLGRFLKDPVELSLITTAESLPMMAQGMTGAVLGPAGTAATMFASSGNAEATSRILGYLQDRGVDLKDPAAVKAYFADATRRDPDRAKAEAAALGPATFDALTGGFAGQFLKRALGKGALRVAGATAAEIGTQMAGGAAGSIAASKLAGEPVDWGDVLLEIAGEIAPFEAVGNVRHEIAASRRQTPDSRLQTIPKDPITTPPPAYDNFGEEAVSDQSSVVSAESDVARFAREQREAMADLRRLKAEQDAANPPAPAEEQGSTKAEDTSAAEVAPTIQQSSNPAIQVSDAHRAAARQILTDQAEQETAPTIHDDLDAVTRGPIAFGLDQAQTILNAKDAAAQTAYQKPYAKLTPTQRKVVDKQLRMSTDTGLPADQALQALAAQNPKFADWTADDLANALADAGSAGIPAPAGVSAAAVESLAAEIAQAEQPSTLNPQPSTTSENPFSLAPATPTAQADTAETERLAAQHAAPGQRVRVFHNPAALVNGQIVEGTVDDDGTIALNAAAPNMQEPGYVAAKVRHETAHVALTSPDGQAQLDRLAGKLTPAQKAALGPAYLALAKRSPDPERYLTNEFIARQAENNTAWWKRYVAHVRDWLAGRKGLREITNEEVAQAILRKLAAEKPIVASNATVFPPAFNPQPSTPQPFSLAPQRRLDRAGETAQSKPYEVAKAAANARRNPRRQPVPTAGTTARQSDAGVSGTRPAPGGPRAAPPGGPRQAGKAEARRAALTALSRGAVQTSARNPWSSDPRNVPAAPSTEVLGLGGPGSEADPRVYGQAGRALLAQAFTHDPFARWYAGLENSPLLRSLTARALRGWGLPESATDLAVTYLIQKTGPRWAYKFLQRGDASFNATDIAWGVGKFAKTLAGRALREEISLAQDPVREAESGALREDPLENAYHTATEQQPDSLLVQQETLTLFEEVRAALAPEVQELYDLLVARAGARELAAWQRRHDRPGADELRQIQERLAAVPAIRDLITRVLGQEYVTPPRNYSLAQPTDTRRLSRQIDASNLSPEHKAALTNRVYEVANMSAARAVAAELVQTLGLHPAADAVLDTTNFLPPMLRAKLLAEVAAGMAARSPEAYGEFMDRAIRQTTTAGQFISGLQGFAQATPEGAVATARRVLDGVAEHVLAQYHSLLTTARRVLRAADASARTETRRDPGVQQDAAAAVDDMILADPEVQKALREEARQDLANEPATRNAAAAALPPGSDITGVLQVVLDHFRFEPSTLNPQPSTLRQKLIAAGVPETYAEGFAKGLEAAWKRKVDKLNADLPKHLRNLRLSREVIAIAEDIALDYTNKAQTASERLKAKFAPAAPGASFSLAASDANAETISELADVAGGILVRENDITLTEWTARAVAEFGQGVAPFLESAFALAQERLAAERGKKRPGPGGRPVQSPKSKVQSPQLPDSELNRLLRAKLKQWQTTLAQALGNPQAGRQLGDAIVTDSGLTGPAAEKLRARLNQRFAELATRRKQAALKKLEAGQPDSKPVKSLQAALRKLVELHNAGALDDQKFADAIKQALGLKTLTPEESAKLRALAQELQTIPTDQEQRREAAAAKLANQIARLRPGHWWDFPMALWYAHVLSGPATHLVNAGSNALNLAGALAAVTVRNPARLQQILPQLARGLRQAVPEAVHALITGAVTGPRLGEKWNDPGVWDRVDSKWLLPWKLVGRSLAAADLLFFYPAYQVQQGVMARAIARSENLTGRALNRRVSELLFNTDAARSAAGVQAISEGFKPLGQKAGPRELFAHRRRVEEIIQQQRDELAAFGETGREFALRTTFNNSPYGVLGAMAGAINAIGAQFPITRLVVPFTNIIANVTNESLNYTPIGSLRALATRYAGTKLYGKEMDVTAWADREALADLHAKAAIGTLLLTGLVLKALSHGDDDDPPSFAINGQGPGDANKRKTWLAAGNLPNSIKVGDRFYSFLNTPLAVPLAVIGNFLDAHKYGKLDDASNLDRTALALTLSARSIVQQSFLDSLARLTGAIEHPTPRNAARNLADWAGRTLTSVAIPNALRQIEQIYDPAKYDDYTIQGELLRHIPFARANERPTLNGLGEPITRPLSERFTKAETPDPLWRELARLNVGIYPTNLEWQGERLTEEQLYEVMRLSGPKLRADLDKLTALPTYSRWSDEVKTKAVEKYIQARHKEAKVRVISHQ